MVVKFKKNFYTQAYSGGNHINHKVFKENPQFKYAEPKFSEYSKLYTDSGWFGRKIIAIPAAAWAAIIKTMYHLSKSIFCDFLRTASNGDFYFKAQVYSIVRDLQESFGRILSIFHDRSGLFHIQQAQFYKSCYECFYENDNVPVHTSITKDDNPSQKNDNQSTGRRPGYDRSTPITTSNFRSPEAHETVRKFNEGLDRGLRETQGMNQNYKQKCLEDFKNLVQDVVSKFKKAINEMQIKILLDRIKMRIDMDVKSSGAISKEEVYSILMPYFENYPALKQIAEDLK